MPVISPNLVTSSWSWYLASGFTQGQIDTSWFSVLGACLLQPAEFPGLSDSSICMYTSLTVLEYMSSCVYFVPHPAVVNVFAVVCF